MAASISASVDGVGVTSRLRDYVGARASEYRRAELEPMVARAAFEIPGTAAVRWRSRPSSGRVGGERPGRTAIQDTRHWGSSLEKPPLVVEGRWRETWQDRRGRIGHDSTRRPGLSPHARALPPRLSEKDDRNAETVCNPANTTVSEARPH